MFKTRKDEPHYAYLWDKETKSENRYGQSIETVVQGDRLRGQSMQINGDNSIGDNPNRYKQHGFFFTADNCIGCHACEAACSEKNDNPAHIAFRSVGFVESGSYPDYARINISMACNHCDDPVCLKGCPTRAYTKFAEYGAVLQDPDICFGCGYCTWVCPYNAPQLDPVKGQVSKCNMCVDRLEVGLKPACVSACLGNALDFGVIENLPEGRHQARTQIPGFPTPDITRPNIRFQLKRSLQQVFTRPDSAPVKYVRSDDAAFQPAVDERKIVQAWQWNFKALLSSHENAHIIFTLSTQAVMGAFFLLMAFGNVFSALPGAVSGTLLYWVTMAALVSLQLFGLVRLNLHLGKPLRFYRGFNNWRLSPVSREIAGVSAFFSGLGGFTFAGLIGAEGFGWLPEAAINPLFALSAIIALLGAFIGLYYMIRLYLIPARPFWNHWQTASSFIGTTLYLGAGLIAVTRALALVLDGTSSSLLPGALAQALTPLALVALIGLVLEAIGLYVHARDLTKMNNEGQVAHSQQTTRYGKSYWLRNGLLGLAICLAAIIAFAPLSEGPVLLLGAVLAVVMLASAIIGRALFYVLVIPTTMPGAFFWRNKGFEDHARASGLATMPQIAVTPERH